MKISVIIPVYNSQKYIEKCINSVIKQTYTDWEIIALNDGSSDDSYNVLLDIEKKDKRIKVIQKRNEGPGLTRNMGVERATGEYIVFLDSDDYIEEDYFELLVNEIETTKADVVFIDVIQEKENGEIIRKEKMSAYSGLSRKDLIGVQMTGKMPWGGVRKAVSLRLIKDNHIMYSSDSVGEEAIYSFDLLRFSSKVSFIPKGLYHYVNHDGSQSKIKGKVLNGFIENPWTVIVEKMRIHLERNNVRREYSEALNSFALTALVGWLFCNKNHSIAKLIKEFKKRINLFTCIYNGRIEKKYLRKQICYIYPLIKIKAIILLIIMFRLYHV